MEPSDEDLKLLRDSNNILEKQMIIRKFGLSQSPTVIYPILNAASKGNQQIIVEAADALYNLKKFSSNILRSEITNEDYFIRWTVALTIQKLENKSFSTELIKAIGIGYEPVVKIIAKILHNWHPDRYPSSKLQDILQNLSFSQKQEVAYFATKQLGMRALDSTETIFAIKILKLLEFPDVILPLIKTCYHHDYRIQQEAENFIKGKTKENLLEICKKFWENPELAHKYDFRLNTEQYDLYLYSIEGLGRVYSYNSEAKTLLIKIIKNGQDLERFFAIRALKYLDKNEFQNLVQNYPIIKPIIKNLLKKLSGKEKLTCIEILGNLEENWTLKILLSFLEDKNPNIRLTVLNALSKSNAKNILEKIAFLLIDENRQVRNATIRLFEELEPEKFHLKASEGNIIDKMPEPIRNKILEKLTKGLQNKNSSYQSFAAFWLGTLNYKPAIKLLIEKLNSNLEEVKISTIVALGIIGSAEALPYLTPLIYKDENPQIQKKVIETIGNLGEDGEGVQFLIHQLYQKDKNHPKFLEKYIKTFGGRVIPLISKEIEIEKDDNRKMHLKSYLEELNNEYQLKTSDNFKIIL